MLVDEFSFCLVSWLHWVVTDRRLLVENMEIRQAESKSSPPGEFEKNLKLNKFFKCIGDLETPFFL